MAAASATKSAPKKKASAASLKLQPLGDRVVIEREESETKTAGGILLPESAKNKPARGVVISVGSGRLTEDGKRHPLQVKEATASSLPTTPANNSKSATTNSS